jgi:outer membrane protein assembly factor BamB
MNTFSNRLYILDTGTERIWKYYPQDTGFTQQEDDPFISFSSEMDLDQAVDFDIYAEDGSIIVIYRDGRIRYYDSRSGTIQWDETTLAGGGLTAPFVSPAAVDITGRGLTASIFVLDPGSNRLVQLSRGGTVLAQYRVLDAAENDILSRASDFIVVESPLQVYIVAANTIYQASRN